MYNEQQMFIISKAVDWYLNSSEQIFQYTGGPGTGKTFILFEIIRRLQIQLSEIAPMAYTGAATIVMRTKGMPNASTIHSWLYEPVECVIVDENNKPVMDPYFNRPITELRFVPKDLLGIKLIIIDEGSMVPLSMRNEILSRNIKIIVCGDLDQLPPIEDTPAFLHTGKVYRLTQIMRQAEGSGIVYISNRAKLGLPISCGLYNDMWVTTEDELTPELLVSANIILCGRNATRDKWNKYIRENLLGIYSTLPITGDKMICRKNNRNIEVGGINLANGLSGVVSDIPDVSRFDGKTYRMNFKPNLLNSEFVDLKCDYMYLKASHKQKQYIKNSKYNDGEKFEFGYSSTVHLSQGSQYVNGIYFEEYMGDISNSVNYTAITRFSSSGIYVKHKRRYY